MMCGRTSAASVGGSGGSCSGFGDDVGLCSNGDPNGAAECSDRSLSNIEREDREDVLEMQDSGSDIAAGEGMIVSALVCDA